MPSQNKWNNHQQFWYQRASVIVCHYLILKHTLSLVRFVPWSWLDGFCSELPQCLAWIYKTQIIVVQVARLTWNTQSLRSINVLPPVGCKLQEGRGFVRFVHSCMPQVHLERLVAHSGCSMNICWIFPKLLSFLHRPDPPPILLFTHYFSLNQLTIFVQNYSKRKFCIPTLNKKASVSCHK